VHTKGVRISVPTVAGPRPVAVGHLAMVALVVVAAAVALPYRAFLTFPDPVAVAAGLAVSACGLVLLREHETGPAGWLLYAAGIAWFVPSLDVTGVHAIDVAIRCTALLHVAFLTHAVVVVGARRSPGRLGRVTVVAAYAVALTALVGGYAVALPALGALLVACVLVTAGSLTGPSRSWRTAAGLVLGLGLVVDAVLRWRSGAAVEPWIALAHPLELAATAVLVAIAGTRPSVWRSIDVRLDGTDALTGLLADQLGVANVGLALSDGEGGWLQPSGERRQAPAPGSWPVLDQGRSAAVIEGDLTGPPPASVDHVLRLAAANARLRRSFVRHVEELDVSRRRLLTAADGERAALGSQLRTGAIGSVASVERELRRRPALRDVVSRAAATRRELESIARGIDPVASAGSLAGALDALASTSPSTVLIAECAEPESREVATALWFCCAEAAANTAKHAPGAALTVRIRREGDSFAATYADDGPGGADRSGRGLTGVADRVEAIGGLLQLDSPPGGGTTLAIELPDDCGEPQSDPRASGDPPVERTAHGHDDRAPGGTS